MWAERQRETFCSFFSASANLSIHCSLVFDSNSERRKKEWYLMSPSDSYRSSQVQTGCSGCCATHCSTSTPVLSLSWLETHSAWFTVLTIQNSSIMVRAPHLRLHVFPRIVRREESVCEKNQIHCHLWLITRRDEMMWRVATSPSVSLSHDNVIGVWCPHADIKKHTHMNFIVNSGHERKALQSF